MLLGSLWPPPSARNFVYKLCIIKEPLEVLLVCHPIQNHYCSKASLSWADGRNGQSCFLVLPLLPHTHYCYVKSELPMSCCLFYFFFFNFLFRIDLVIVLITTRIKKLLNCDCIIFYWRFLWCTLDKKIIILIFNCIVIFWFHQLYFLTSLSWIFPFNWGNLT